MLDGLTLFVSLGRAELSGFGALAEFDLDGSHYEEAAFGIQVCFPAVGKHWDLGFQMYRGRVTGAQEFTYWMFAAVIGGIPLGSAELSGFRAIVVKNLAPRLPPADGTDQPMRLYRWYKENLGAVELPQHRALTAWAPKDHSSAWGAAATVTFAGTKAVRLHGFFFKMDSPDDAGFVGGLELYALKAPKPIAFAAFEWDDKNDKWGLMIGFSVGLEALFGNIANVLSEITFAGLLFFGNKPDTLAIGQYNDTATWPSVRLNFTRFWKLEVFVGFCYHRVDAADALDPTTESIRVYGLIVSGKGNRQVRHRHLQDLLHAELGVGAVAHRSDRDRQDHRVRGGHPDPPVRLLQLRREREGGPRRARSRGDLVPQDEHRHPDRDAVVAARRHGAVGVTEGVAVSEVMQVSRARSCARRRSAPGRAHRSRSAWPGRTRRTPPVVYSFDEARAIGAPAVSDQAFAALPLIGCDSEIALDFKVSLDASATVLPPTPAGAGRQDSEELSVTYEIVSIGIRRRRRHGDAAGAWADLVDPLTTELEPLFGLPPSQWQAHFQSAVGFDWDADVQRIDRLDPRRLLLNAVTPYSFLTGDPAGDEVIAETQPGWPCCTPARPRPRWHVVDFADTQAGARTPATEAFTDSTSTLHWIGSRPPVVVPPTSAPAGTQVALIAIDEHAEGIIATASFDQPARICEVHAYWSSAHSHAVLVVEGFRGLARVVSRAFVMSLDDPGIPIRFDEALGLTAVVIRKVGRPTASGDKGAFVELVMVRYRTLADERRAEVDRARCDARDDYVHGQGRLAWLPNTDYEITVRTRAVLGYTRTGEQEAFIDQKAYFRTKGLPGLNAVAARRRGTRALRGVGLPAARHDALSHGAAGRGIQRAVQHPRADRSHAVAGRSARAANDDEVGSRARESRGRRSAARVGYCGRLDRCAPHVAATVATQAPRHLRHGARDARAYRAQPGAAQVRLDRMIARPGGCGDPEASCPRRRCSSTRPTNPNGRTRRARAGKRAASTGSTCGSSTGRTSIARPSWRRTPARCRGARSKGRARRGPSTRA